tara:strand:+ start:1138 stop:1302 length:165 start_codon:yes stop_codon:yes gene_type:complete
MPKKVKKSFPKPVFDNQTALDIPGAVEKSKKVKATEVFDFNKKKDNKRKAKKKK